MNIYIIGHLNLDKPAETCGKYNTAMVDLTRQGFTPKSPVNEKIPFSNERDMEAKYRTRYVCESEAVFVMADWQNDNIAVLELALASLLNKKIIVANGAIMPAAVRFTINKAEDGE